MRRPQEEAAEHQARLEREHTSSRRAPTYNVLSGVLNAADYGIPQVRHRVFIVGFRSDLGASWSFPEPTHARDALLAAKWLTGEYWDGHSRSAEHAERPAASFLHALRTRLDAREDALKRWTTVRDALTGLPDPRTNAARHIANHVFNPGARQYVGHTGSLLDEPAKTLKAGQHGVPGGENMMVMDNGAVRYFTVREAARLQTFPDDYSFQGAWGAAMRQLGNAVPVSLAEIMARSVATALDTTRHQNN